MFYSDIIDFIVLIIIDKIKQGPNGHNGHNGHNSQGNVGNKHIPKHKLDHTLFCCIQFLGKWYYLKYKSNGQFAQDWHWNNYILYLTKEDAGSILISILHR